MEGTIILRLDNVWMGFWKEGRNSLRDLFGGMFRRGKNHNILWALKNISFEVKKGEAFGIVGPNGAGKTTILKLLAGILFPDKGNIIINGKVSSIIELGVGFHPDLTAKENIFLNGAILGIPKKRISARMDEIIKFAELEDFVNMPLKHYSSGMKLRLGFSIAVHTQFDILVVDEILAVGDEAFQRKSFNKMKEFKEAGKTIVIVSHRLNDIERFCDRTLFLNKGEIVILGDTHKAIDEYLNFVKTSKSEGNVYLGKRWGTQEAEILNVKIMDKDGNKKEIFFTGEPLIIKMEYIAHKPIEKPSFGIAIHTRDGCLLSGPNTTETGFPIEKISGKGIVYYRINSLPLHEGVYTLTTAIYDFENKHPYDHHDRMYVFQVKGRDQKEKRGSFSIDGEWKIEEVL